ncbi:hypothetical protein EST38_g4266 [Candolleomyces aberdarensis]|uniref:Mob1/phocein n=1 Tax=Candolleomyces aberdarensis TaxID=2316362 RepID=A0A4Q2DNG4_9AGAR|nr:hypothetical protein EST38_g4266 [Candolleomyces aberdarensis]
MPDAVPEIDNNDTDDSDDDDDDDLHDGSSAFQLQEYISLLIRLDVHDVEAITSLPGKDSDSSASEDQKEEKEGDKSVAVDKWCWIYEQLRRLAQDLTQPLITSLQQECTRQSCPEMKAGEWLYLCVAHGNEGSMEQCCAIDYILHTLDSATALLNSPRAFPSRLQIPPTSHRHFASLARRLGRIFAHAFFHHKEIFMQAEVESSLYRRFLALSEKFELVPPDFLPIPSDAFASAMGGDEDQGRDVPPPSLHSASLDPSHSSQMLHTDPEPSLSASSSSQHLSVDIDTRSPPGLAAEGSPRRMGRNRTDTMVPSEASSIIEELAARAAETPAELSLNSEDDLAPSLPTARPPAEDAIPPTEEEPSPEELPAEDEPQEVPEPKLEAAEDKSEPESSEKDSEVETTPSEPTAPEPSKVEDSTETEADAEVSAPPSSTEEVVQAESEDKADKDQTPSSPSASPETTELNDSADTAAPASA